MPAGQKHERSTVCRLRCQPAKPMGSPRVGPNPTGVVRVQSGFVWKANTLQVWGGMI